MDRQKPKLKILIAAAECAPFAKTGGLADVAGSLPKYLCALGLDVRVMIPFHRVVKEAYAARAEHLLHFEVGVGWRRQYAGVEKLVRDGVTFYFIDNEYYFGGPIYKGGRDEGEQYAFFTRAMLESLPLLDFVPDLLHCNDWHTAMAPLLIKTQYRGRPQENIKTLLTIHNLAFQGYFDYGLPEDLFSLDKGQNPPDFIDARGCASFMRAGLLCADKINTVSPSYAREILGPAYGCGLDGLLRRREKDLSGILNGIDNAVFDPASDPALPCRYFADDMAGKRENKLALMGELGLTGGPETPLVAMVTRMTAQKGFDFVVQALDELMEAGIFFVLVGTGDEAYEDFMRAAESRWPGRLRAWLGYNEALAHRVYAAADLYLMPSVFEPCGLSQMIAMRYGAVPVVRETGGLRDTVAPYNRYEGTGTGFSFAACEAGDMKSALYRALDLYRNDKNAFSAVVRRGMEQDFGFESSAQQYAELYETISGSGGAG